MAKRLLASVGQPAAVAAREIIKTTGGLDRWVVGAPQIRRDAVIKSQGGLDRWPGKANV